MATKTTKRTTKTKPAPARHAKCSGGGCAPCGWTGLAGKVRAFHPPAGRKCVSCGEPEDGGQHGWFDAPADGLRCMACGKPPLAKSARARKPKPSAQVTQPAPSTRHLTRSAAQMLGKLGGAAGTGDAKRREVDYAALGRSSWAKLSARKRSSIMKARRAKGVAAQREREQTAQEHAAADARCGRDWLTGGCACGACKPVRAQQLKQAQAS